MAYVQDILDKMKICALIPVYNEAQNIGPIVERLRHKNLDVVVIDDGSEDDSGAIACQKGAFVITHEKRSGKGQTLRDGFRYAIEKGYEGVVTIDGDGQHDIDDLEQFLRQAEKDKNSVITGDRMQNHKGMPVVRLLVNRVMSGMISGVCRQKILDTQCGYRYIGTAVLKEIPLTSSDYEIESEVLIKASRKGFKIYAVPIKTIYSNEHSKINPFVDTVRFFKYMLKETFFGAKK